MHHEWSAFQIRHAPRIPAERTACRTPSRPDIEAKSHFIKAGWKTESKSVAGKTRRRSRGPRHTPIWGTSSSSMAPASSLSLSPAGPAFRMASPIERQPFDLALFELDQRHRGNQIAIDDDPLVLLGILHTRAQGRGLLAQLAVGVVLEAQAAAQPAAEPRQLGRRLVDILLARPVESIWGGRCSSTRRSTCGAHSGQSLLFPPPPGASRSATARCGP